MPIPLLGLLAGPIFEIGGKLIDRLIPDPIAKEKAKAELVSLYQKGELAQLAADTKLAEGQLAINKIEAGHKNIFVAGWRPFIGWVCGAAFALHFLLLPIVNAIMIISGRQEIILTFDMSSLMSVLLGMLGLGGLRTIEKLKKIS